jgi:hypothetical protein
MCLHKQGTLVMHGEDDQIVPVKDSAKKSARLCSPRPDWHYSGAALVRRCGNDYAWRMS